MYNNSDASPTLTNVTFGGNLVTLRRRRDVCRRQPDVDQCHFQRQQRRFRPGGGIYSYLPLPDVDERDLQRQPTEMAAGCTTHGGSPTLTNVTFSGNAAA